MTACDAKVDLADRADYWLDARHGDGDELWVTFGSMTFRQPVLGQLIESRRASALHVISRTDDWYRNFDPDDLLRPMRDLQRGRVILFGVSMGGFGALMFSRLIAPDVTICVAPQTIVDSVVTKGKDERFRAKWDAIEASDPRHGPDAIEDIARSPIAIVLDPLEPEDVWHAGRCGGPSIERFRIHGSGHDPLGHIRRRNKLGDFMNSIADSDFGAARRVIENAIPPRRTENPGIMLMVRP